MEDKHSRGPWEHVRTLILVKMCRETFHLPAAFRSRVQSSRDSVNLW